MSSADLPQVMDIDGKDGSPTSWNVDLQQIMKVLKSEHYWRVLELQKKAAKKGSTTLIDDISLISGIITSDFPAAGNFETPWMLARALDQLLVECKTKALTMKDKKLIFNEIDKIRKDFVKKFDPFMKKHGYCCGLVWGSKHIDRCCSCMNPSPIIFVHKKLNEQFPDVFCDNCVGEYRDNCRKTHHHDYVEMEIFSCHTCKITLHKTCAQGFTENCCSKCDLSPFRYNNSATTTTSSTTSAATSPLSTLASTTNITNLIQTTNYFVKLLLEKKCQFSKPELLEDAMECLKGLRQKQNLGNDNAMMDYLKPSSCLRQIIGFFFTHEEGDVLLALSIVEQHGDSRCLIEIFVLPTTIPSVKNKKDMVSTFFVEIVKLQRSLVKTIHVRVPRELQKNFSSSSAEIYTELASQLPKNNIAIKKLNQTLADATSLFQIPCFSDDPKFDDIINIVHELGFKIDNKPPKRRTPFSLEAATQDYISRLTDEVVVNGIKPTSKATADDFMTETAVYEDKNVSPITCALDLQQAIDEFHLKFTDVRSCCYSTFKIVSLFYDPRKEALSKTKSVDSGYSTMNSPSSSVTSGRFSNDEILLPLKKRLSSLTDLPSVVKRSKIEEKTVNENKISGSCNSFDSISSSTPDSVDIKSNHIAFPALPCSANDENTTSVELKPKENAVLISTNIVDSPIRITASSCADNLSTCEGEKYSPLSLIVSSVKPEDGGDLVAPPVDFTTSSMKDDQDFPAPISSTEQEDTTCHIPTSTGTSSPVIDDASLTCNEQNESLSPIPNDETPEVPTIPVTFANLMRTANMIMHGHPASTVSSSSTRDNTPLNFSPMSWMDEVEEPPPPPMKGSTPGPEVLKWLPAPTKFSLADFLAEQKRCTASNKTKDSA